MYTLIPGQAIQIKDEGQLEKLGAEISNRLDHLEQLNQKYFNDIRIWWRQYEAVPRLKQKDFPFQGSSNIVIPFIKTQVEAMVARTMDRVFAEGHRVWDSRTENSEHEDMARDMVRYQNWQADDNDFDFRSTMEDWLREFYVIGSTVLAGNYRELRGNVFLGKAGGKVKSVPMIYQRGPILEHVPRHLIQWDHSQLLIDTDLVSREYEFSYQQLMQRASGDPDSWYRDNLIAVRYLTGSSGPSEDVRQDLAESDSQQRESVVRLGKGGGLDVREVHVRWPLDQLENLKSSDLGNHGNGKSKKNDPEVELPIVATIHRKSRKILRLVAAPYHIVGFPFFEGYYSKRPGRGHSTGAAKDLEQIQAGITTTVNQAVDAQTRANSIWAKSKDLRHLEQPINPQIPIHDPNDTFEPLNIPGAAFGNFNLLQYFQGVGERLTGQGDAQFGRETRMGGHPSPATSTMAMLQNSEVLLNPRHGQVSKVLSRAGMFLATVNQQFETNADGRLKRLLGEIDGKRVEDFLFPVEPIPGNYLFSVKGLSRSLNSDTRLNRSMQLFQLGQQYWAGMVAATKALAESIQMPLPEPIKKAQVNAYLQFIMSQNETYKDLLQAADVDDVEKFLFSVENFMGGSRNALEQLVTNQAAGPEQPGGLAGAGGAAQVAPVASAAPAAPFGAAGTTGIPT